MIKFIKEKNIRNIIRYVIMMVISAIISLAIFPYSFVHMFMGYRGTGAISSLMDITKMWNSFGAYLGILCYNVFNGIVPIMIFVSIGVVIYKLIKNKKVTIIFENTEFWIMFIPTIIYFTIVALISPYQELRYIMPVCPLLVIGGFYLLKVLLEKAFSKRNTYFILSAMFVIMLILPSIIKPNIPFYYLYKDKKEIVTKIEQAHNTPVLYVFNKEQNRFLDDLYLFTISDQSYIMDAETFSKEKLKEVFTNINLENGLIVIINEGLEHETYLKEISEMLNVTDYKHIQRMNACDIYQME